MWALTNCLRPLVTDMFVLLCVLFFLYASGINMIMACTLYRPINIQQTIRHDN